MTFSTYAHKNNSQSHNRPRLCTDMKATRDPLAEVQLRPAARPGVLRQSSLFELFGKPTNANALTSSPVHGSPATSRAVPSTPDTTLGSESRPSVSFNLDSSDDEEMEVAGPTRRRPRANDSDEEVDAEDESALPSSRKRLRSTTLHEREVISSGAVRSRKLQRPGRGVMSAADLMHRLSIQPAHTRQQFTNCFQGKQDYNAFSVQC